METETHRLDDGTEVTLPAGVRVLSLQEWAEESGVVALADSDSLGDYFHARDRLIGASLRQASRRADRTTTKETR